MNEGEESIENKSTNRNYDDLKLNLSDEFVKMLLEELDRYRKRKASSTETSEVESESVQPTDSDEP